MGLYTIPCPSCKQPHAWFSGSIDQRCPNCKRADHPKKMAVSMAPLPLPDPLGCYNGEPLDGTTRLSVDGDIYPEPAYLYWYKRRAHGTRCQNLPRTMTFGEWVQNIRTQRLMELYKHRLKIIDELRATARVQEDFIKLLIDFQ